MGKKLIIVESPAKVKTIKKFLGSEYMVEASIGHVRDLPSKVLGVDEEHGFEPQYQIIHGKEKVVSELCAAAAKADTIYLAPDPDREGEAIAWHIAKLLADKGITHIQRIQFNEITAKAVAEALEHPRKLNANLFDAQQARRILDRLVGYKISPLLWKTVKRGISAGRVQSVALRLVVDREIEREHFEPEEYWLFKALLQTKAGESLRADLVKVDGKKLNVSNQAEAQVLYESFVHAPFIVKNIEQKRRERAPLPPFITSTLQQLANQRLGYSSRRTMSIAQRLYEGIEMSDGSVLALITYMRTDSTRLSEEAQASAASFISTKYGEDYLPKQRRQYKVRENAQDAHEAIRPVNVFLDPEAVRSSLSTEQYNIYKLIWSRFVASQMNAALFLDTVIDIESEGGLWQVKGQRELFDGWLKAFPQNDKDNILPELSVGEELRLEELQKEQKFTQPPARFSEASLVRSLEELGIGRPSTYASIISTLEEREYVSIVDKRFMPTDLGRVVCQLLIENFAHLMDVHFTAEMEAALDRVADGSEGWKTLLENFAADFNPMLETAARDMRNVKEGLETELLCPECSRPLRIKFGKAGAFLGCSNYPSCKFTSNFLRDEHGKLSIAAKEEKKFEVVGTCPDCGSDLVVKKARNGGGRFIGCSNYPECKFATPFSTGVACPQCGQGTLVEKTTKRGKIFYSCSRYPDCTFAMWDKPIAHSCPQCNSPYLVLRKSKEGGTSLVCPNKECGFSCDPEEINDQD